MFAPLARVRLMQSAIALGIVATILGTTSAPAMGVGRRGDIKRDGGPVATDGAAHIQSPAVRGADDGAAAMATSLTMTAVADTHVFDGAPSQNFGRLPGEPGPLPPNDALPPAMIVGGDDHAARVNGNYRGLMRFDTSSIPRSATILAATLSVYYVFRYDYEFETRSIGFFAVDSSWSENSVTWNTRPSTSATRSGSVSLNSGALGSDAVYGWKDVDLDVSLVQAWVDGARGNYGLMLQDDECERIDTMRGFGTKEGSFAPKLIVEYTLDAVTATRTPTPRPTSTRTPTRTPTLESTATPRPSSTATATITPEPTSRHDGRAYLPSLVMLASEWPAPVPVVATPRPACVDVLENGDFEAGSSGWILEGNTLQIWEGVTPHSGRWSAKLGGVPSTNDVLRNSAAIRTYASGASGAPDSLASATLRFAWMMPAAERIAADKLVARLVGDTTSQLADITAITGEMTTGKWIYEEEGFDVTELLLRRAGWRHAELQFRATNDFSIPTTWYLDDVVLEVCTRPN